MKPLDLAGEDLAVIGQDLFGDPVGTQGMRERIADRLGGGSNDEARADAEPRVVIDPGDGRELGAVG